MRQRGNAMSKSDAATALTGVSPVGVATASSGSRDALFVIPSGRGDGFRASIRGHLLELADPSSAHGIAPTPDDLLVASIASDCAWFARRFLRARGLPDYVSVSAEWRAREHPRSLASVAVTVTVHKAARPLSGALVTALEDRFAARSLRVPLPFRVRAE